MLAAIALPFHEYRLVSLLVFFGLLVAGAAYWYGDRVALGMVGARELPVGETPLCSTGRSSGSPWLPAS